MSFLAVARAFFQFRQISKIEIDQTEYLISEIMILGIMLGVSTPGVSMLDPTPKAPEKKLKPKTMKAFSANSKIINIITKRKGQRILDVMLE
jgi:hypothetical protein